MAWYLRAVDGGTDAVEFETLDQALMQVKTLINMQRARGYQVVKDTVKGGGRVSFFDGYQLIDTVWVEDEDGLMVPIP